MNNIIKAAKFEPEPTFENINNEIKDNCLKSITSISIHLSDITLNKPSSSFENIKAYLVPWIILQSPGKSPQITKYWYSMHPKVNTQQQIRKL